MADRRLEYLEAMGIHAWSLRLAPPFYPASTGLEAEEASPLLPTEPDSPSQAQAESLAATIASIDAFPYPQAVPEPVLQTNVESLHPVAACPVDWDALQAEVKACTACALHQTRTQTVFGVGDPQADWMVIGEAPGEQEDLQGEPFVGRAGLLLNEMLRAIGLSRERVFIANILKCRPPKNRDPQPNEAAACENYLKRQIAHVKPKIILAVGRIAAQNLLKTTAALGKLRGRLHDYQGVPLVVTYHPAYLLRSPLDKRNAFDDLRLARQTYRKTTQP